MYRRSSDAVSIQRVKMSGCLVAVAGSLFTVAILCPSAIYAGEPSTTDSESLETIVVTAERRAETIQETPLSVTAITGDTLEKFDVKGFDDYANLIPNLSYGTGNNPGLTTARTVTIRGVAGTNINGGNTTTFYINDTPLPLSLDPRILDVERIEVLSGPQGTLFGSSSMGGTVRIITRAADTKTTEGLVDAQGFDINHGGAGYDTSGTINVPLIQGQLALKASAYSSYDPGVFSREYGIATTPGYIVPASQGIGVATHVGDDQEFGGLLTLTYTPAAIEGLTVTPMVIHQTARSNGFPLADFSPDNLVQVRPLNVEESTRDDWNFEALTARYTVPGVGSFISSSTGFHRESLDDEDGTDAVAVDFGAYATPPLSNVYQAAPAPTYFHTDTFAQEVRFESAFTGPFQAIVGAYYNHTHNEQTQFILTPYDGAGDFAYASDTPRLNQELAEFLALTYDVTRAFQISAGVRESELTADFEYTANGWLNGGPSTTSTHHVEHALTPRYTAKYTLDENAMLYANAAKGYRIGGNNIVLPPLCNADESAAGFAPGGSAPFVSDSLWSYELGSKNSWDSNRIHTRLAAYYIDWKNIQQSVLLACTFPLTENAGAAVSKGVELEADISPIRALLFNLAVGYDDAKITQSPTGGAFVVGQPLNGVPKWTASLLGEYSVPTSFGAAFVRGKYSYTGRSASYDVTPAGRFRDAYSLVDLHLGVSTGAWETSLFAKNLFDVRANLGDEQAEVAELQTPSRPRWLISQPRTIGIECKYAFKASP
jgi:iron complex outermembrane recepter protein